MAHPISRYLPELVAQGLITPEAAGNIRQYYENQPKPDQNNRLLIVFGILGALLTGLGILLILAHNWEDLDRWLRTLIAFIPLLVGQGLCAYTLLQRPEAAGWREGSATFLLLGVGISLALVSQIYQIPGELTDLVLVWVLLSLPLIYLMRSSLVSFLYICGVTWYTLLHWQPDGFPLSVRYWGLLLPALPYYINLIRRTPRGQATQVHNWLLPLSVLMTCGQGALGAPWLIVMVFACVLGAFYLLGTLKLPAAADWSRMSYTVFGSGGTVILLLILSYQFFWEIQNNKPFFIDQEQVIADLVVSLILCLTAITLLVMSIRQDAENALQPIVWVFPALCLNLVIGMMSPLVATVAVNGLILLVAVLTIRKGALRQHLGILNYGMLIFAALVICRFTDTDLSFVLRGLLFIAVGAGFFAVNIWIIRQRKTPQ
ncbi:MAG: DUF2157 domain-containing protein [Bacteroidia bacterium]|nr:DUF2157 domain-containing protein [Bacteroidia bacterium]